MKLGLVVPNTGVNAVEGVLTLPQFAENAGYDTVWVTDHVIGVKSYEPVYGPIWMEALASLAYMAATTKRVRLGIGVMVTPYREPVYAAKVISTIDNLSAGRTVIGIGTGWSRSEFNVLGKGALFEKRGAVTDEAIELMKRCWQGGEFGWSGTFTKFRAMEFAPVPVQKPHPPLWIGGTSNPALRRAARSADVWHPSGIEPAEIGRLGKVLDDIAGRAVPRSIRFMEAAASDLSALVDKLLHYRDAGCVEAAVDLKTDSLTELRAVAAALADKARKRLT